MMPILRGKTLNTARKVFMQLTRTLSQIALATTLAASSLTALAAGSINIYSARHYKSDEAMYAAFSKETGIAINRVDSDDVGILNRLKSEGANSPADVVLMVDGTRLWKADQDGLLAPVQSTLLD